MKKQVLFFFGLSLFTFCIVILSLSNCAAQQYHNLNTASKKALKDFNEAQAFLNAGENAKAIAPLEQAVAEDEIFIDAWLLLGEVYNDQEQWEKGKTAFEKGIALKEDCRSSAYYFLAQSYWNLDDYDGVIATLTKYLTFPGIPDDWAMKSKLFIADAKFAKEAVKHPVPFNPIAVGSGVNTDRLEMFPYLTADEKTILFMRRDGEGKSANEDFYESHYVDSTWTVAKNLGSPLNSDYQDGAISVTEQGTEMYFASSRMGGYGNVDIYYSQKKNGAWQTPINLGKRINTPAWDSQPTISADGKTLYFASTRDGGLGGSDIWMTQKDSSGHWTNPVNVGKPINTYFDEQTPFIHPDGQTLYFSSYGHPGMGSADIFLSRKDANGKWSEPQNLGYPINTKDAEGSFYVSTDGKHAYFASDLKKQTDDYDLYYFNLPNELKPLPVNYLKGIITNAESGEKISADVQLIDLASGNVMNSFSSDPASGYYLISIPSGKNYALNVSKKGFLFHSENFSLADHNPSEPYELNIKLQPMKTGESVVLKNIFFETGSAELKKESTVELDKLISLLKENPTMKIEIGGHTDNVGSDNDNLALSENRAKSVYDYLIKVGVGAARLSFKGYGETKPIATNDTEEGRAQNRRTEFTVVSTQ